MKSSAYLGFLYAVLAAIATLVNLGGQALTVWGYRGSCAVELSILVGTAAGLPTKYLLDKHYIFVFRTNNLAHDGKLFLLYALTGVFTTMLFWGTEYGFHRLFNTDTLRYLGGVIGLSLGFILKYQLDKRFVFTVRTPTTAGVNLCGRQ
ncbi:GtrA family protein [Gammaproteobacteria bacterium]